MNDTTQTTHPTTRTLDVPGACLAWDVRPDDQSPEPILLMVGYPMGAGGFVTQAGHFTDRTVVTYDPRGIERSTVTSDVTSEGGWGCRWSTRTSRTSTRWSRRPGWSSTADPSRSSPAAVGR